ncbi:MAG: hypothetical protein DDT38_01084 [Firmicutes bacterium]|nr:hypothetical protein [candidate division NPL-UPA2 bacterium]
MSYVFEQKVGKHTYLYECTAYRDHDGNPRNKRVIIGKTDLKTGLPVYKPEYLERMREAGTPVEIPPTVHCQRLRPILSAAPAFRHDRTDSVPRCFRASLLAGDLHVGMLPHSIRRPFSLL